MHLQRRLWQLFPNSTNGWVYQIHIRLNFTVPWVILDIPCDHTKTALFDNQMTLKRPFSILADPWDKGISAKGARLPKNCYNVRVGAKPRNRSSLTGKYFFSSPIISGVSDDFNFNRNQQIIDMVLLDLSYLSHGKSSRHVFASHNWQF